MTVLGAVASILLKLAVQLETIERIIISSKLWLGGLLYLAAAVLNIIVLRTLSYSVVLPMTSITYIWTLLGGKLVFEENINKTQIGGIIFLIIGAYLITME